MKISDLPTMFHNRRQRETVYSRPEYWNSKAANLEGAAVSMWPNNYLNQYYHVEQLKVLDTHFSNIKGIRILDVGCGTGRNSRYLASRGAIVTGIDFAAEPIALARKLSDSENLEYRVQSVFDLDDSNVYDAVLVSACVTVACKDATELQDVILRLRRAMRSSGKILFVEPINKGFLHRVLDMDVNEFCAVLDKVGVKTHDITHLHFWPTRLLLAYIQWPRFITAVGYHLGDMALRLLRRKAMGDYKAIYALKGTSDEDVSGV